MDIPVNKPLKLHSARAWRTYLGGRLLDELYGKSQPQDSHFPEEWMMSVVSARNVGREHLSGEGLSMLDGYGLNISLKEIIASAPAAFLGEKHFAKFGGQMGVLVKLIDSAERLTVQVHPDRAKAKELFQSEYGKTECWHILGGRTINGEAPCIYLGFKPGVTREHWKALFDRQDVGGMLDCLHRYEVKPGDTFLIEGGIPHAIGAGCFLAEIQEPTDYTIRVERTTPSGFKVDEFMCHQGLGFERMFDCFSYNGLTAEETLVRWKIEPVLLEYSGENKQKELIGYGDTSFFRLIMLEVADQLEVKNDNVFSGFYVLDGDAVLEVNGESSTIKKGDQFFLPAKLKSMMIRNTQDEICKIMRYFGPDPA